MTIPGSANPLLLASKQQYLVQRSLRFNSSDSGFCSRTPASAGNRRTWTWAGWVKRAALGSHQTFFHAYSATNNTSFFDFRFDSADKLVATVWTQAVIETTQVFRDAGAWFHLVLAVDTTNGIAANRLRLYINGVEVTAFSQDNRGSYSNADFAVNAAIAHNIGSRNAFNNDYYFSGYLADIHFIDGQALTPSSFTETSATTGQLIPKKYTGTFGTNGFWLQFADNSSNTATTLGKDTSPNGNNWTPVNVSTGISVPSPVSSSTGALPVYNTTGTYGETKGTGTRTDSNSSSIVLAVAMDGTNGGTTFSDLSATIKGSGSAKTITNSNVTTATAQSKYYGSSGLFDSGTDQLTVPAGADFAYGTGDVTWECWAYPTSYPNTYIQVLWSQDASGVNYLAHGLLGNFFGTPGKFVGFGLQSTYVVPLNRWTHLAAVRASGVVSLYVNGVSVATGSNTTNYSDTSRNPAIGGYPWDTSSNFYGYMQDVRVYKGVAKYTANFIPPASTGDPYLNAACDSLVDTPVSSGTDTGLGGQVTGNYATFLGTPLAAVASNFTRTNGNLDASGSNANQLPLPASIFPSSGKWYCELVRTSGSGARLGVINVNGLNEGLGNGANGWCFLDDGRVFYNGSASSYGSAIATNDIFMIALDIDAGKVWYGSNGAWFASGNPATGANASQSFTAGQTMTFAVATGGICAFTSNWGARPFAYTAPSGFKALCDTNLPTPAVAKTTTGTFTGNAAADGPFVFLNYVPTAMTINGNAVTFGTHADKLASGFKVRTNSTSYNTSGSNSYSITTTGADFKYARAQANP